MWWDSLGRSVRRERSASREKKEKRNLYLSHSGTIRGYVAQLHSHSARQYPVTTLLISVECTAVLRKRRFCYRIVSHCSKDNCFSLLMQIEHVPSIQFPYHNPLRCVSPSNRYLKRAEGRRLFIELAREAKEVPLAVDESSELNCEVFSERKRNRVATAKI